jgi:hypothetical protein
MAETNQEQVAQIVDEYVEIMNQEFFEYVNWYTQGAMNIAEQHKSDIKEQFRKYLTTFASKL